MATRLEELRDQHRDRELSVLAAVKVWVGARGTVMEPDAARWLVGASAEWEAARAAFEAELDAALERAKVVVPLVRR